MPTLVGIAMLCSSDVLAQELNTAVQPSRYEFEIKGVDASVSLKLMSEITGSICGGFHAGICSNGKCKE